MAIITGSSKIDWSSISLSQIDFEGGIIQVSNRSDQIAIEFNDGQYTFVSLSPTLFVVDLFSGGRLRLGLSGSNFSFDFTNNLTGEVIKYSGRSLANGNDLLTSATLGSTGFLETISGNITIFPDDTFSGSVTSLVARIGTATVTLGGTLSMTGDNIAASLTGTVTGISVTSGTNTIKMTGLSVDIDLIEAALASDALATVNDLLSVVGNLMSGNDTITYTNNSSVGMAFSGGAGNDTITINGLNADTLNGGDGNDILMGGLGLDTVNGNAGDDRITMLVTTGNVDTIDAGVDSDTLVLSGIVPGDHVVVVDLSSATDQIVSIGGVIDASTQVNLENINASAIGSSVTVTGSNGANTIVGSKGNDVIDGGTGNDTLSGGLGSDTYTVDSTSDVVAEALNAGIDLVQSSAATFTLGANVDHLTLIGGAGINGTGNALNNILTGNSGVNVLTGLAGGDIYVVQNDDDSVVEALNAGIDLVQSMAANFTLGANVENLTLTGAALNGTGNALNNILTGNSGHNTLSGEAGADRLLGGDGDDTLLGGLGSDVLIGGIGVDNLDGGAGIDNMAGGQGDDTYVRDLATDVITEALNAGTDTVNTSLNYTLGTNLENLTLTGTAITGTGNALANVLTGNSGNNTLSGLAGTDQLNGGDGNDTLLGGLGQDIVNGEAGDDQITMLVTAGNVDTIDAGADNDTLVLSGVVPGNHIVVADLSAADQIGFIGGLADAPVQSNFENFNATLVGSSVTVTGSVGANIIVGSNGNDILNGVAGNDTLNGGLGNDQLTGGDDNDVLNGGLGADTMTGGLGDDNYVIDNAGDIITELDNQGIDTVQINRTVDLNVAPFTEIENVVLTGTAAFNATGNGDNNVLMGNSAANILLGGDGIDQLTGNGGNDTLNGGAGNDTLDGGAGNDTYVVDSVGDSVTEALAGAAGGTDLVQSTASNFTLGANVENLTLIGSTNIAGTGNALNNILIGNSGNNTLSGLAGNDTLIGGVGTDTLDGGAGTDKMTGGLGNDTYVVDVATDVVTEALNAGTDTVIASINYTLGTNVEDLLLNGIANLNGTGNAHANVLIGNSGSNVLSGLGGNDTLLGFEGNDTLRGGLGNDTYAVIAGDGQDTIQDVDATVGNADKLLYSGGTINPQDLVISRQVNDLRIAIQGTTDSVTIQNWYTSSANRTETIQASNGDVLLSTNVDQLIQAMAQFSTDTGLTWDAASGGAGDPAEQAQFQGIIAANWQS